LLAGCAAPLETLRPAAGGQPAIRATIERPEGPGPFSAAVPPHNARNGYSPTGRGATVSYCPAATRQAEALALDFLRGIP
jgi:hypothetical protein